jgi:hypothetical protein
MCGAGTARREPAPHRRTDTPVIVLEPRDRPEEA